MSMLKRRHVLRTRRQATHGKPSIGVKPRSKLATAMANERPAHRRWEHDQGTSWTMSLNIPSVRYYSIWERTGLVFRVSFPCALARRPARGWRRGASAARSGSGPRADRAPAGPHGSGGHRTVPCSPSSCATCEVEGPLEVTRSTASRWNASGHTRRRAPIKHSWEARKSEHGGPRNRRKIRLQQRRALTEIAAPDEESGKRF